MRPVLAVLALLPLQAFAQAPEPWAAIWVDPAAQSGAPADLMLPMPCGASMAFQKVEVPLDATNPLDDRRIRLGQSQDLTGYSDYLRPEFLRGAFSEPGGAATHYYIARYELTAGQARTLRGDCAPPTRPDRTAQGGLSWFEAVTLAQLYSGWLYVNATDSLPRNGDAAAFVRLPTEAEWEYAVRGGARADATLFAARTFLSGQEMRDVAWHQAPGSARGQLNPVATLQPNPLGLHDVYGNAEELMLEPFRLNAIGRLHGQAGGIVTRGGSILSGSDEIYSAARTEYPPYDAATGAPLTAATIGARFVLATHVAVSDARVRDIQARWIDQAGASDSGTVAPGDPLATLRGLIEAEVDPRRQTALAALQQDFRSARAEAQEASRQSAASAFLAGAVLVDQLSKSASDIQTRMSNIRMLLDMHDTGGNDALVTERINRLLAELDSQRGLRDALLLSYRSILQTLAGEVPPEDRRLAFTRLQEDLRASGRSEIDANLDRFGADLGLFVTRPDMSSDDLLAIAVE